MSCETRLNVLYDPIRKKWVALTKEEKIRQRLIKEMVESLGYPSGLIAVEKELSQLPHLLLTPLPKIAKRRADIVVFAKGSLSPLLIIECKAVTLTPQFANQVLGYNAFVQAPFVSLANEHQILTGHYDQKLGHYTFFKGIPTFSQLQDTVSIKV